MRAYGSADDPAPPEGPLAPDLTRSTTFRHATGERLRAVGTGEAAGEFYPRYGHPNGREFERAVARMEGAAGAVAFASGMAALHAVLCGLCSSGETVAASRDLYGGTVAVLDKDLPRFGIDVKRFDPFHPVGLPVAPRLIVVESPTNPLCRVPDLPALAAIARATGAILCVDSTFAPPPIGRALALGADLVMHSVTKFFGGHSDVLGGVIAGPHRLLEKIEGFRRRTGGILSPDSAWLATRSMKTHELRVSRQQENAGRLARFLEGRVRRVCYPGLASHPDHEIARRDMNGFGTIVSFEVDGGLDGALRVYDRFRLIARAVSLGGLDSKASLPLHTSHAPVSAEDRARSGIADGLIRLSVGIEEAAELEADLAQALGGDRAP